jgi:hypothetical protein
MPVRVAEVLLAKPATTPFAILGGDNHVHGSSQGETPWQNYPTRLTSPIAVAEALFCPRFLTSIAFVSTDLLKLQEAAFCPGITSDSARHLSRIANQKSLVSGEAQRRLGWITFV